MRPSRVIQGTFLMMMFVQIIGTTDEKHRLPAPKQFIAIFVLWGILFLMAGTQLSRIAARLSVLVLLTGMVLGPFGSTAITFLRKVSNNFAVQPASQPEPATGAPGATHIS